MNKIMMTFCKYKQIMYEIYANYVKTISYLGNDDMITKQDNHIGTYIYTYCDLTITS